MYRQQQSYGRHNQMKYQRTTDVIYIPMMMSCFEGETNDEFSLALPWKQQCFTEKHQNSLCHHSYTVL